MLGFVLLALPLSFLRRPVGTLKRWYKMRAYGMACPCVNVSSKPVFIDCFIDCLLLSTRRTNAATFAKVRYESARTREWSAAYLLQVHNHTERRPNAGYSECLRSAPQLYPAVFVVCVRSLLRKKARGEHDALTNRVHSRYRGCRLGVSTLSR